MMKEKDTADYFLASRSAGWFLIGSSIFASNIGAEHLIGLAGSGAESGMAFAHWELHSYLVLVLGWIFAPFYLRANIFTTPEFLERRYTPGTRTSLSIIFLFALCADEGVRHDLRRRVRDPDHSRLSDRGPAVVRRDGFLLVLGDVPRDRDRRIRRARRHEIGALDRGDARAGAAHGLGRAAVRRPRPDRRHGRADRGESRHHHLWRPLSTTPETQGFPGFLFDPSTTPWLGVLLCSPIIGLWYWCTDQYIVQRVLTARGLKEARRGTIFAAYLKLAPVFIFLFPGMIAVALWKQGAPGFESIGTNPQSAFPVLVSNLLPIGLRGLVLAGMLSALMSALASLFNSTATLFTVDIYKRLRPESSEKHLVNVGRIATGAVIVLGMLWIPFLQHLGGLYTYLQLVQSLIAPGNRRGVHAGHLLEPRDAEVRPRRTHHRFRASAWRGCSCRRRTSCTGIELPWLHPDVRRHQLAVLQLPAVRLHLRADLHGQPVHAEGVRGAARGPHLQVGVRATPGRRPPELWFLGDFPHLRDRRNHRRHLHLLLVTRAA